MNIYIKFKNMYRIVSCEPQPVNCINYIVALYVAFFAVFFVSSNMNFSRYFWF